MQRLSAVFLKNAAVRTRLICWGVVALVGLVAAGGPDHAGNPGGAQASIGYQCTAPFSGTIEFDTEGSGFDTILAAYTESGTNSPITVTNLNLVAQNDDVTPSD